MTDRLTVAEPGHTVYFYGVEGDLAAQVSDYLASALRLNHGAVVVATPTHTTAFAAGLARAGIDVDRARAAGFLITVDAEALMREFIVADQLDVSAFRTKVGGLIDDVRRGGRPVRVYGEMVALLWAAGEVNLALELESLWNDLRGEMPFALLCSYPAASVDDDEQRAAFEEVCRLHSDVHGPIETSAPPRSQSHEAAADFDADVHAPRAARQFVVETLHSWGLADIASDAALVVSELATNSVVHARSSFTVALVRRNGVRIVVRDRLPLAASPRGAPFVAQPAHGLGAVAALAEHWGIDALPDGKQAWAELTA